ncbi:threonine/serine exporter family protein [Nonomuraea sp. NBC_01738]|uniref:threonine/serine ThrE exporter family protein n=1 Tax=Nonomuraea sp. NBC_01738 TaxID=2976003 RepID=UPI002E1514C3|nr:threonine/serine exporter family protein [Nonomuraea sp. NBC_01738]
MLTLGPVKIGHPVNVTPRNLLKRAWARIRPRRADVTVVPKADDQGKWTRDLAELLCELGGLLVSAGAITADVEGAISDVAARYGVRARSFIVPTGVIVRVGDGGDEVVDFTPAIPDSLQLGQIQALYSLVETLREQSMPIGEAREALGEVAGMPGRFSPVEAVAGYAVLTLGLGMIQHPTVPALLAYAALGIAVGLVRTIAARVRIIRAALPVVAAATVTMVARVWAGPLLHESATLMLIPPLIAFLPGTMLTMGAIELASGAMISGMSRLAAAANVLLLLAFGILVGTSVATLAPGARSHPLLGEWAGWAGVMLLGIGFVICYSASSKLLPWLLVVLLIEHAVQVVGSNLAGPAFGAFLAGLLLPVVAYLIRRRANAPAQVLFLPSFWMLVPGSLGLQGVSELVVQQDTAGLEDLVSTIVTVLSIALGVLVGAGMVPRKRLEVGVSTTT